MEKSTTAKLENRSTNNGEERWHLHNIFTFGTFGWCHDRQDIEKLQKEQEELHRNLGICKNFSRLHRESEDTKTFRALLEEEDTVYAALIKEKEHQQELDKEVNHSWFTVIACSETPS